MIGFPCKPSCVKIPPVHIARRKTKQIQVGSVKIGGDAPISVQSMTIPHPSDVRGTLEQIQRLEEAGCELIRVAVPDNEAADTDYKK